MSETVEIRVPDIGDFEDVPVIEVLVAAGDEVAAEQSLITLESDKATMEVPSPRAGVIESVAVEVGSKVAEGTVIATLRVEASGDGGNGGADEQGAAEGEDRDQDQDEGGDQDESQEEGKSDSDGAGEASRDPSASQPASEASSPRAGSDRGEAAPGGAAASTPRPGEHDHEFDVVVLGAGPGGYTAAFRAADLGLKVALVERYASLGGVCLNVGCIPSKALLHTAQIIDEAAAMAAHGVHFGDPRIDLDALREFKNGVVGKLTGGLAGMAKQRGVTVITGRGEFTGPNALHVAGEAGEREVGFAYAIIAAGSQAFKLPGLPWDDPRVMDSTDALELADIPGRLLVVGGGIIGLEMACVFQALGSRVTVVELTSQLMPGTDTDLVRPLQRRLAERLDGIHLDTKVTRVEGSHEGLRAFFEGPKAPEHADFDRVLVSVGRVPNGGAIGAERAGVEVTERGFIPVDKQMRTNVPHIFAIGDLVGQPMLAHKATHEGKVAAEVIAGHKSVFDARVIPSVAYTDPEVAWAGLTEGQAKEQGIDYGVGKFPWAASGRALGIDRPEGFTKLLFDKATDRIIGAGIVGPHAGDLIAECVLAIEMGCEAADIGLSIHPHPTLSESVGMAAEAFEGTITDLYLPKRR